MRTLLLLAVWVTGSSVARADARPADDAAECFCFTHNRDLQLGHFETGGAFVVDVPLWPGPDGKRAQGDVIETGLTGVPTGPAIIIDGSLDGGPWCAFAVPSANPKVTTLSSTTCDQRSSLNNATCDATLTLRQVAKLVRGYDEDRGTCIDRAHALGVPDPRPDDACASGGNGPWSLAFVVGFVAMRRPRRVSVERR